MNNRRIFLKQLGLTSLAFGLPSGLPANIFAHATPAKQFFDTSLAEFSFATSLFTGQMNHLDFPAKAKEFGFDKVEYVSMFFKEKPANKEYLGELKKRANDNGVRSSLIMVDSMGNLGDPDAAKRQQAVENHIPWIEAAKELGCNAIRVNLDGEGSDEDVAKASVEGYSKLVEIGEKHNMNILVENHIGPSVNPDWLVGVMKQIKSKNSGLLVDTANFIRYKLDGMTIEAFKNAKVTATYDKYDGVTKLMPYAKGVSLKTHEIDKNGKEASTDFTKLLKIIKQSGFKGTIGVEYEGAFLKNIVQMPGEYLPEADGIKVTHDLLKRIGSEI